jgi:hypothetical protein
MLDYYTNPERVCNVLYLSDDPEEAARMHCDTHVAKALVWTGRVLSMVWHTQALIRKSAQVDEALTLDWAPPGDYTPPGQVPWSASMLCGQRIWFSDPGHPCVGWAALYGGNYDWLYRLGQALQDEYTHRFERLHASIPALRTLELVPPSLFSTLDKWCDSPAVVPQDCVREETVDSYRTFYKKYNRAQMTFTNRQPPDWL